MGISMGSGGEDAPGKKKRVSSPAPCVPTGKHVVLVFQVRIYVVYMWHPDPVTLLGWGAYPNANGAPCLLSPAITAAVNRAIPM